MGSRGELPCGYIREWATFGKQLSKLICVITMKRRNTRKCDSFDFIKISPKRASSHANSISLRDPQHGSPTLQIQSQLRDKHYLELPKIHALHPAKIKRIERENQMDYTVLENRLLLLGCQYRRQQDQTKETNNEKKEKEIHRKKLVNKDSFISKRMFTGEILASFGISEVILEKKKLLVYVEDGNNSRMVKEMLRKRQHLVFVNDKKEANLVWTRFCDYESSKLASKFYQEKSAVPHHYHEDDHENDQEKISKSTINEPAQRCKSTINKQNEGQLGKQRLVFQELKYHNHLTNHYEISDKKSLFSNLQKYCAKNKMNIFDLVPLTFEVSNESFQLSPMIGDQGFWFIKPGEDTNRGNGISIASGRNQIRLEVENLLKLGKTALIQQYIDPLLYKNRKFDIRCYALVLSFRGELRGYWYKEGYIRTCSKEFNYDITDVLAHLTNDAIQKKSPLYGKYEQSNKLSFGDMDNYLKSKELNFKDLCEDMKELVVHSLKSVEAKLKSEKNQLNFQIFGYDFLIDKKGKVWLIEINTNPCLQFTGSLTSRVIGHMIDNSLKIALDPLLSSEVGHNWKEDYTRIMEDNKYQLIF